MHIVVEDADIRALRHHVVAAVVDRVGAATGDFRLPALNRHEMDAALAVPSLVFKSAVAAGIDTHRVTPLTIPRDPEIDLRAELRARPLLESEPEDASTNTVHALSSKIEPPVGDGWVVVVVGAAAVGAAAVGAAAVGAAASEQQSSEQQSSEQPWSSRRGSRGVSDEAQKAHAKTRETPLLQPPTVSTSTSNSVPRSQSAAAIRFRHPAVGLTGQAGQHSWRGEGEAIEPHSRGIM